jgi:ubiquinone/menaquinone biosynthesis C-methylase UbiE
MNTAIIDANIEVHTKMADSYNDEPHFRQENQDKVKLVLKKLQSQVNAKKLVDVGCGTGFILNLAKGFFDELHGVDITQAMLDKVDTSSGNITLHNSKAESLPFENSSFDMATSYAFLHHLEDYTLVLKEVHRILKEGAIYYIDLDPNKHFWKEMDSLERADTVNYNALVQKEIDSVLHTDDKVMEEFGISPEVFNSAEYTKSILGGIDPKELCNIALELGYSEANYEYVWYLGQGTIMHEHSFKEAEVIDNYLQSIMPLSKHLYKYVKVILIK